MIKIFYAFLVMNVVVCASDYDHEKREPRKARALAVIEEEARETDEEIEFDLEILPSLTSRCFPLRHFKKQDPSTLYRYGSAFHTGEGAPKNPKIAVQLYKLAAEKGHSRSQYNLGCMYRDGEGAPKNPRIAARFFKLAAEQNLPEAQYNLGCMYKNNKEQESRIESVRLFALAAEQNLPEAQYNLGCMYRDGEGAPKNPRIAARFFKLAAEQNLPEAQYNLGRMYRNGEGVSKNVREGNKLIMLAAEQKYSKALLYLRHLEAE